MVETGEPDDNAFWRFAIDRYARNGVSQRCLALQNRLGADVCVALFCLWKGQDGLAVSRATLKAIDQGEIGRWHRDVVQPLRRVRQAMKACPAALSPQSVEADRRSVKLAELAAERQEITMLALLPDCSKIGQRPKGEQRATAIANLTKYLLTLRSPDGGLARQLASDLGQLCID